MTLGFLFWLLMILTFFFNVWSNWPLSTGLRPLGGNLLVFILIGLLGWQVFGPVLHR